MGEAALSRLADLAGIHAAYVDLAGVERRTGPDTQRALLRALGFDTRSEGAIREAAQALADARRRSGDRPDEVVIASGRAQVLPGGIAGTWHLSDVDTGAAVAEGRAEEGVALPPLAPGLYALSWHGPAGAGETLVIAAPACAPSVDGRCGRGRIWGLTAALYGLRSAHGGAIGSYGDLARLAEVAAEAGASFLGINPIHALGAEAAGVTSPYSPSHRCALNSLHVAAAAGGDHGAADLVDYGRARARSRTDLDRRYRHFLAHATAGARADFAAFRAADPLGIAGFAGFEAISETHGADWRAWPRALHDAQGAAVARHLGAKADRIDFHIWVQWLTDRHVGQAAARARDAGMGLGLYLDLAVGARRGGGEAWAEAAVVAEGVSVGAPPDHLSPAGQNWDLTALSPRKLKAQKYDLFRRILRAAMRHAGVLRIDHVLGLARSFWIPDDGSPGGYVSQPLETLVAIVKIEAVRAGVVVIGEDLGLVPQGFRETMRGHGIYGYAVLQYERTGDGEFRSPADYDAGVLACFGSHDTPTVAGYRAGSDIGEWQKAGWIDADAAGRLRAERARDVARIRSLAPAAEDFAASVETALAGSAAAMVSVQLDDILGLEEAQNLPGTIDQHPNWRRRYPVGVEDLADHRGLTAVAARMAAGGRSRSAAREKEYSNEH